MEDRAAPSPAAPTIAAEASTPGQARPFGWNKLIIQREQLPDVAVCVAGSAKANHLVAAALRLSLSAQRAAVAVTAAERSGAAAVAAAAATQPDTPTATHAGASPKTGPAGHNYPARKRGKGAKKKHDQKRAVKMRGMAAVTESIRGQQKDGRRRHPLKKMARGAGRSREEARESVAHRDAHLNRMLEANPAASARVAFAAPARAKMAALEASALADGRDFAAGWGEEEQAARSAGWTQHFCQAEGRHYYHNVVTEKTQWERPWRTPAEARWDGERPQGAGADATRRDGMEARGASPFAAAAVVDGGPGRGR